MDGVKLTFVPSCAVEGGQPMVPQSRAAGRVSAEPKMTQSLILVNVEE